jgi:hypothetical protein
MNPLLDALYRKVTRVSIDGRSTQCECCKLAASVTRPPGSTRPPLVRHMPNCELAKLYEAEGGEVEWRGENRFF